MAGKKKSRKLIWFAGIAAFFIVAGYALWPHMINLIVPYELRPDRIRFAVETVTEDEFEAVARELVTAYSPLLGEDASDPKLLIRSFERASGFDHIDRFREAGIRSYEGPETCLQCHQDVRVPDGHGGYIKESLRQNILGTVHFAFNVKEGFNTWGFNGERVDKFPLGKIDRACGIPGSFTWTGWAKLIKGKNGQTYSEGCGQCHIGGQYGPSTGTMMPGYRPTDAEFDAIDCLICHSREYDMNRKQVVQEADGRMRWDQDRSVRAMMSITRPNSESCLRCHQHNHGGDFFVDNDVANAAGYDHPRLLHHGAKRGNPWKAEWDVHASAGMQCIDCHVTAGHRIARGTKGTDLVANDLPGVEVSCTGCHSAEPHNVNEEIADQLNEHAGWLACETCHITRLLEENIVLRDWAEPVYHEEEGLWLPKNVLMSGDPKTAMAFKWFNGEGHFMAGALGDNPNGSGLYQAFETTPAPDYVDFDYDANYEQVFRPISQRGTSKIHPFKRFNARMFEDLNNQGPYGGMLLPFDYPTYYETGDPKAAVLMALENPIIQMMYGPIFKAYMMDQFMAYMNVDGWNTNFSADRIEPRWMRQEASLMLNHGIEKQGRSCNECHTSEGGLLNFTALGYPVDDAVNLSTLFDE